MTTLISRNGSPVKKLRIFSPFEDFENIVNRMFEPYYTEKEQNVLNIPVELAEKNNEFILKARLAGMKKENINIEIAEDYVTISGEYKKEEHDENTTIYRSEFSSGGFSRTIGLPVNINHQKARADYKEGVLTVTLPKKEKENPKITKLTF